jgi:cytidyltransferase-like protein
MVVNSDIYQIASVHGRFQPLHLGHMEYIMAAFAKANFLFVGLTQPDIRDLKETPEASHRAFAYSNPLTYFERRELIVDALSDAGKPRTTFEIIPFPIETPARLPDFLPVTVPCLTTVYDDWNREKVRRLVATGYKVDVLWDREEKAIQGSVVRDLIRAGRSEWLTMVPAATVRAVDRFRLRRRLENLMDRE